MEINRDLTQFILPCTIVKHQGVIAAHLFLGTGALDVLLCKREIRARCHILREISPTWF